MASRKDENAMAGMIRRTLAHDAKEATDCPSPETVAAYYEGALGAKEKAQCHVHFSRCARCREQLAAMVRAEEEPHLHPHAIWVSNVRWLVPAVAALTIAFVWVARRYTLHGPTEESSKTPLVAMSRPAPAVGDHESVARKAQPASPSSAPSATETAPSHALSSSRENLVPPASSSGDAIREATRARRVEVGPSASAGSAAGAAAFGGVVGGVGGQVPSKQDAARPMTGFAAAPPAATPVPPPKMRIESESSVATGEAAPVQLAAEYKKEQTLDQTTRSQTEQSMTVQQTQTQLMKVVPGQENARTAARGQSSGAVQQNESPVVLQKVSTEVIIKTPNPTVLWRILEGGFIERSEDSGATWNGQMPNQNGYFIAGSAPSATTCWLVGRDGMIVLTKDGRNWKKITPPAVVDLVAITARDSSAATVTTADGHKFETSNGGKSWTTAK